MSSIFPKPDSLQVRRDPQLQIQVLISLALMLTLAVLIPPQIPPKYSEVGPWGVSYVFDKLIIGGTSCSPFWVNSQSSPLMLQDSQGGAGGPVSRPSFPPKMSTLLPPPASVGPRLPARGSETLGVWSRVLTPGRVPPGWQPCFYLFFVPAICRRGMSPKSWTLLWMTD